MRKWEIESELKGDINREQLIELLLLNRGIKTKKQKEEFLEPKLETVSASSVGIDKVILNKALKRIKKALDNKEKIAVFGDYDVDGICGTAILWEVLYSLGADVVPYIPNRFDEGYGLSEKGIINLKKQFPGVRLVITVDNGIVANEAVSFAKKEGVEVIITDHHVPSKKLPDALIVHTTSVCGASVAYILSGELLKIFGKQNKEDNHLELVALATVADLVPLTEANRTLLKYGLERLKKTARPGILALFNKAGIKKGEIGTYEIGHIIAPRLNAMGRLETAMDSLRLVCTKNPKRAEGLAKLLNETNIERQQLTQSSVEDAKSKVNGKELKNLIFIADESYQQGIIGLIAGRLVEEYYLPSIVVSKGERLSKASVRSVRGFNIIEFLRTASDMLVDVGGHPMAAGFTVETQKLELLEKKLLDSASKLINKEHLDRVLRIDCLLPGHLINLETFSEIQKLSPFGMANPEPTFSTKGFLIEDLRLVGNDGKHLKLKLKERSSNLEIEGIAFGMGESNGFRIGDKINLAYQLEENVWNNNRKLQLNIKDIKKD